MKKFRVILGVDQTGAAISKGQKAKPLPLTVAVSEAHNHWYFRTCLKQKPLFLSEFKPQAVAEILDALEIRIDLADLAIVADCVLGLPQSVWGTRRGGSSSLWNLFSEAASFQRSGKEFGREVAEAFFQQLLKPRNRNVPKRKCEMLSGSNSLFQIRPYQKNIQTGTFRFWKELGQASEQWVHIWPFDGAPRGDQLKPWLFEGYPSLFWREELNLTHRNPELLRRAVKSKEWKFKMDTWNIVESSPDHADAFVLTYGAVSLQHRVRLCPSLNSWIPRTALQREGWILGLKS